MDEDYLTSFSYLLKSKGKFDVCSNSGIIDERLKEIYTCYAHKPIVPNATLCNVLLHVPIPMHSIVFPIQQDIF